MVQATKSILMVASSMAMLTNATPNLRSRAMEELTGVGICSSSVATTAYDAAMPPLIAAFNSAWPSIASSSGIDPLTSVTIPDIDVSCEYGGDEICGAQLGSCKKSWIQMDFGYLDGLGDMEISSYSLGDISTSDSSCDSSSLPEGATCGYNASPPFTASLVSGNELKVQLKNIKFRVKCDTMGDKSDETIASIGTVTCKSSNAQATMDTSICGSSCNIFSASVSDFKISSSTSISCDSSSIPSWAIDPVVDALKTSIYSVLEPIAEKEINAELSSLIGSGYPSATCN